MSDGTSLVPWQHKEFYSIESVTNEDLDAHCSLTEDSRGREIKDGTHSAQERFTGSLYEKKFDSKSGSLLGINLSLAIMNHYNNLVDGSVKSATGHVYHYSKQQISFKGAVHCSSNTANISS